MEMHRLGRGIVLIDDTYNANPRSMISAVQSARDAAPKASLIAVLGDMRELGPDSGAMHREVGRQVAGIGVDRLVTLGELAGEIEAGAMEAGLAAACCAHVRSHEEAVGAVRDCLVEGSWIVVKGSRGMAMEKVVAGILEFVEAPSSNPAP